MPVSRCPGNPLRSAARMGPVWEKAFMGKLLGTMGIHSALTVWKIRSSTSCWKTANFSTTMICSRRMHKVGKHNLASSMQQTLPLANW